MGMFSYLGCHLRRWGVLLAPFTVLFAFLLGGCSAIVSNEGVRQLEGKTSPGILTGEDAGSDLSAQNGERRSKRALSNNMRLLLSSGRKVLDSDGKPAAIIERFNGVEGYDTAKDSVMLILNTDGVAVEYRPTQTKTPDEYFQKYVNLERYQDAGYSQIDVSERMEYILSCLELEDAKNAEGSEQIDWLPVNQLTEDALALTWIKIRYVNDTSEHREYFGAVPYSNGYSEGTISVHMRFQINHHTSGASSTSSEQAEICEEENFDEVFLKAASAVVPIENSNAVNGSGG